MGTVSYANSYDIPSVRKDQSSCVFSQTKRIKQLAHLIEKTANSLFEEMINGGAPQRIRRQTVRKKANNNEAAVVCGVGNLPAAASAAWILDNFENSFEASYRRSFRVSHRNSFEYVSSNAMASGFLRLMALRELIVMILRCFLFSSSSEKKIRIAWISFWKSFRDVPSSFHRNPFGKTTTLWACPWKSLGNSSRNYIRYFHEIFFGDFPMEWTWIFARIPLRTSINRFRGCSKYSVGEASKEVSQGCHWNCTGQTHKYPGI